MIRVANDPHAKLTFAKSEGLSPADALRAAAGIESAVAAQTEAAMAVDKAKYRLEKATSYLEEAGVAYFSVLNKSTWNKEELRKAYNNALAGHRDADAIFSAAEETLATATAFVESLREIADGNFEKAHKKDEDDSSDDDDSTEMGEDFSKGMDDGYTLSEDEVLCPVCLGMAQTDTCGACGGVHFIPATVLNDDPDTMMSGVDFTTKSLTTRDFQNSPSYQEFVELTKGGPGSGAQPGHAFYGNGHVGGMRNHPRLGIQRGWKDTVKKYEGSAKAATDLAKAHEGMGRQHESMGRKQAAYDSYKAAQAAHMQAQGAHQGIAATHTKEAERGSAGADLNRAAQGKADAAASRAEAARMGGEADRILGSQAQSA